MQLGCSGLQPGCSGLQPGCSGMQLGNIRGRIWLTLQNLVFLCSPKNISFRLHRGCIPAASRLCFPAASHCIPAAPKLHGKASRQHPVKVWD